MPISLGSERDLIARLAKGALCRIDPGGSRLVAGADALAKALGVGPDRLAGDLEATLEESAPELLTVLAGRDGDEACIAVAAPGASGADRRWLTVRRAADGAEGYLAFIQDETVLHESRAKEAAARSKDVETSARLQAAVLAEGSGPSALEGVDYQTATVPSKLVDGDFIEVISLSEESADFILGDVMGKGMEAAIVGAMIKLGFARALASSLFGREELPNPAAVCSAVEAAVVPRLMERKSFAAITYARIEFERRALRFVDCGHTSIAMYSPRTGLCWRVKGGNMPLGFAAEQRYRSFILPLDPGDILLLFTDGLSECRNRWGEALEEERIMYILRTYAGKPAADLASTIMKIGFDYSAAGFNDDVSIICVKYPEKGEDPLERSGVAEIPGGDLSSLGTIEERLDADLRDWAPGLGEEGRAAVILAFHEALVNIEEHALGREGGGCSFRWRMAGGLLSLEFTYSGPEYDWLSDPTLPIGSYSESGYGRTVMREAMDSVLVARGHHGLMRLVMSKAASKGERS